MKSKWLSGRWPSVLLCVLGGVIAPVLSIGVAVSVYRLQTKTIRAEFENQVDGLAFALERELASHYEVLYALKALYDVSPEVTREMFRVVADQELVRHSPVQALEWIPRVTRSERHAHEAAGPVGYRITERRAQGVMEPAAVRDEYFPVYYVEPLRGNELAVGFDLASNDARRATLERARLTGQILATEPITLVQSGQEQGAFLVFLPVYGGAPATEQERRQQCRGFVLGVLRVDDVIESPGVLGSRRSSIMHLTLVHAPAGRDEQVLYRHRADGSAPATMSYRRAIDDPAGLSWRITAAPTADYVFGRRSAMPWFVFAGLFVFTEALALLLSLLINRQRALVEARDRAKLSSRVKDEFLTVMSHELRTPLNSVIGLSDLMIGDPVVTRPADYAPQVKHAAEVLLAAIDDILDLVNLEAGALELNLVELSPAQVVTASADMLRGAARATGLALKVEVGDSVPARVRGDRKRIQQVLLRLIQNAIKFTDAGDVVVRVSAGDADEGAASLLFEVIDAGIGIAPEHHSNIFHLFSLVDGSDARERGGSGVGLALCRRLIGSMGGEIGVESEVERGSRFWFSLTLDVCEEAAADEPAVADEPVGARVLVVDDNPIHRKVLARILDRLGYAADLACDGREAVEAAGRAGYACIFMDCQMPHMDGFQATAAIRELEGEDRRTPIVAVTAHTRQGAQAQADEVGMDEFLLKPVTPEVIEAALSRRLVK